MKNKYSITISGMNLTLHTEYEKEYVDALADGVTLQLDELLGASRTHSKLDAALLLLLDMTDRMIRAESESAKLKRELESLRLDLEIQKIENEQLASTRNFNGDNT